MNPEEESKPIVLPVPRHVAIIMDGNGRWAARQGLSRWEGHYQGAENTRSIVQTAVERGLEQLTLYCFSSENWKRPQQEVSTLLTLLQEYLTDMIPEFQKAKIRLEIVGRRDRLGPAVLAAMERALTATRGNQGLLLRLAINYGARAELTDAVRQLVRDWSASGETRDPELVITEDVIAQYLYTGNCHDPDLIIRTGNESRLSNFLLWQASYAELYFSPLFWPDFTPVEFDRALDWYANRSRRFGDVDQRSKCPFR